MMLSVVMLVAGHCPALPFGNDVRRLDGSVTSLRHETAPKPIEVLDRSFRYLSRNQASSMSRCPVTTYPKDALTRIQEARIVRVSGQFVIAGCRSSCKQPLVGNRCIFQG